MDPVEKVESFLRWVDQRSFFKTSVGRFEKAYKYLKWFEGTNFFNLSVNPFGKVET